MAHYTKLWFRLGVEVELPTELYNKIINEEIGSDDALTEHIKHNGLHIDGDSYIPVRDEDGENTGNEVELSFPQMKLVTEI